MSRWGSKKVWTKAEIITAIKVFHNTRGYWPATGHFNNLRQELPYSTTVIRAFGTLAEARRQAGMIGGGFEGHGGSGRGGSNGYK